MQTHVRVRMLSTVPMEQLWYLSEVDQCVRTIHWRNKKTEQPKKERKIKTNKQISNIIMRELNNKKNQRKTTKKNKQRKIKTEQEKRKIEKNLATIVKKLKK